MLSGIEATISAPSLEKPFALTFVKAEADYSQKSWEIAGILDMSLGAVSLSLARSLARIARAAER